MSTGEASGGDPNPLSHDPSPFEPDQVSGDGDLIPPDPLLEPGTFIDTFLDFTEPKPTGPQPAQGGVSEHGAPEPVGDESELRTPPAADIPSFTEGKSAAVGAESTPPEKKGAHLEGVSLDSLPERPKWLPDGWRMDCKVRSSGATAGSIDRYYVEPVSGRKFRSKKEVEYFLETGSARKRKPPPNADPNSPENSGGRKQKSAGSRTKNSAPLNFDFNNVPDKVRWVQTNAAKDQWTPFIRDQLVPESTRQEWIAAFNFSCTQKTL